MDRYQISVKTDIDDIEIAREVSVFFEEEDDPQGVIGVIDQLLVREPVFTDGQVIDYLVSKTDEEYVELFITLFRRQVAENGLNSDDWERTLRQAINAAQRG